MTSCRKKAQSVESFIVARFLNAYANRAADIKAQGGFRLEPHERDFYQKHSQPHNVFASPGVREGIAATILTLMLSPKFRALVAGQTQQSLSWWDCPLVFVAAGVGTYAYMASYVAHTDRYLAEWAQLPLSPNGSATARVYCPAMVKALEALQQEAKNNDQLQKSLHSPLNPNAKSMIAFAKNCRHLTH